MSKKKVTGETYLREVPYRILLNLSGKLDFPNVLNKNWKGVASRIKAKDGGDRYSLMQINLFEMELLKGKSSTMALINDWGTTNATVQALVDILDEMDMPAVAEILLPNYKPKEPEKKAIEQGTTIVHQKEYTSFTPHDDNRSGASLSSMSLPDDSLKEPEGAKGPWNQDIEVSSSTDSKQPCQVAIEPVESSILPRIPLPDEPVCEYQYRDLEEMTYLFNELPLLKGGCHIGEGGFGTVFRGTFAGNQFCAIKRLKKEVLSDVKLAKQFTIEHKTLAKLIHHHLVRLYGYSFNGPSLCLVFEYLSNGSLNARLACENESQPLQWPTRVNIAQGAAQGISYLHQNGHVHRDIKSANILLDENCVAKIGDFGLVRNLPSGSDRTMTTTMIIGSSAYMAPEAQYGKVTPKIDAYSFGVVLLELMTGWPVINNEWDNPDIVTHLSYQIEEEQTEFIKLMDKKMEHNFGEEAVRKMYECATRLLSPAAKKRPLVAEIVDDLMQM